MTTKRWAKNIIVLALLAIAAGNVRPWLLIPTGYAAKYVCSHTFLSDMAQANVKRALKMPIVSLAHYDVDHEAKQVRAYLPLFGLRLAQQQARYYSGSGTHCGCVVGTHLPPAAAKAVAEAADPTPANPQLDTLPWPQGNQLPQSLPPGINQPRLSQLLDSVLQATPGIHAIVVAQNNQLVAEGYQAGINPNTRLLGWSMTKTMSNALYGILTGQGVVDIDQPTGLAAWQNDGRQHITINNLLQMSSGLHWSESYFTLSEVTRMLYLVADMPAYARQQPATVAPNQVWYYASGTTNILSGLLRQQAGSHAAYRSLLHDSLFAAINMPSAMVETDAAGNYVLSSYGWATARDWTRFGLLYLNNGQWFGQQVLPPGWVARSVAPAPASGGRYGSQMWLNASGRLPSVPKDAYFENGFGGQRILIIPSKNMVITFMSGFVPLFDFNSFYAAVFSCFEAATAQ